MYRQKDTGKHVIRKLNLPMWARIVFEIKKKSLLDTFNTILNCNQILIKKKLSLIFMKHANFYEIERLEF